MQSKYILVPWGQAFNPLSKTHEPICGLGSGCQNQTWLLGNDKCPMKILLYPGRRFYVCLPFEPFLLTFDIDYDSFHNHNVVNCFYILLTADIISTVEFNHSGDLLATGDKGGRVVIFQREQEVSDSQSTSHMKASHSHVTWKEGKTHRHFLSVRLHLDSVMSH